MNVIRCDNCKTESLGPPANPERLFAVELNAVVAELNRTNRPFVKHFCTEKCFWEWAEKNKPKPEGR